MIDIGFNNGVATQVAGKEIEEWFRYGGKKEDNWPRWMQHFHDPNKPWGAAGLKSERTSSIYWAQQEFQDAWANWSWPHARRHYYTGLTAQSQSEREEKLAKSFRALGQILHLLADGSVPAHTRDDMHPEGDSYEKYCKKKYKSIPFAATSIGTGITNHSLAPGLAPISNYWDTTPSGGINPNPYGLAEYTNRYFFSKDTIFHKNYPYPSRADSTAMSVWMDKITTVNGATDYKVYLSGKHDNNETINHLVATGYLWSELQAIAPGDVNDGRFILDEECLKEYASILVPKAVGYGAGLLDYFYRGKLKAQAQETLDTTGNVVELTINVTNDTKNETMQNGKFTLACRYKPANSTNYTYRVIEKEDIITLAYAAGKELIFTIDEGIPFDATDKQYTLVYHGTLGAEVGAVVGKVFEPINGEIAVTAPGRFVFAIADDAANKAFTTVRAKIANNKPEVQLTGGQLVARAKYKRHLNHLDDLSTEPPNREDRALDYTYSSAKPVSVNFAVDTPQEITFNFSADPIPFGVTDLWLEISYGVTKARCDVRPLQGVHYWEPTSEIRGQT